MDTPSWAAAETNHVDPHPFGPIVRRLVLGVVIAVLAWFLGLRWLAAIILIAALAQFAVSWAMPTAASRIDRLETQVGGVVAHSIGYVLMAIVHFVVFWPASVAMKLLRRDPLQLARDGRAPTYWTEHPQPSKKLVTRQFTLEPRSATENSGRFLLSAVGLVVVTLSGLLVANYLIGVGWHFVEGRDDVVDARIDLPAFAGRSWAGAYFGEFHELELRWEPFIGFVRADFSGEVIEVEGLVRSSYGSPATAVDAVDVWFFGGSTMWGNGQRNLHTIPSEVARLGETDGLSLSVRNYGQPGWGLWQEGALFAELLSTGDRPDVVVFYDGVNEANAQNASPSTRYTYGRAAAVREALAPRDLGTIVDELISRYNERSAAYRVFRRFSGSGGEGQSKSPGLEERAENAARLYNMAAAHIEKVAAAYEVDAAFFWQPSAFTKASGEEAARATTAGRLATSAEIHLLATAQVRAPSIDISGVFGEMSEPVYIDWSHTNEVGAGVIASAIYQSILPMLEEAGR